MCMTEPLLWFSPSLQTSLQVLGRSLKPTVKLLSVQPAYKEFIQNLYLIFWCVFSFHCGKKMYLRQKHYTIPHSLKYILYVILCLLMCIKIVKLKKAFKLKFCNHIPLSCRNRLSFLLNEYVLNLVSTFKVCVDIFIFTFFKTALVYCVDPNYNKYKELIGESFVKLSHEPTFWQKTRFIVS